MIQIEERYQMGQQIVVVLVDVQNPVVAVYTTIQFFVINTREEVSKDFAILLQPCSHLERQFVEHFVGYQ